MDGNEAVARAYHELLDEAYDAAAYPPPGERTRPQIWNFVDEVQYAVGRRAMKILASANQSGAKED